MLQVISVSLGPGHAVYHNKISRLKVSQHTVSTVGIVNKTLDCVFVTSSNAFTLFNLQCDKTTLCCSSMSVRNLNTGNSIEASAAKLLQLYCNESVFTCTLFAMATYLVEIQCNLKDIR